MKPGTDADVDVEPVAIGVDHVVPLSNERRTLYSVIALRPFAIGAVHDNVADVEAATPATPVGLPGTVAICTDVDLADSGELPAEFFAITVNVNVPSSESPVI